MVTLKFKAPETDKYRKICSTNDGRISQPDRRERLQFYDYY